MTTLQKKPPLRLALELSFPVFLSYFSLGLVFGALFTNLHESWYFAPLMSLFVYSGAVQFVAIGIMATHGSYWVILFSTIFIAGRNAFYGLSLLQRFSKAKLSKLYLIFSLVDTNYAIYNATPPYEDSKQDWQFCMILSILIHGYWVGGTLVGALFASHLANLQGLEFVLIAFFALLLFEQYLKNKTIQPLVTGLITFTVASVMMPGPAVLLSAIILSVLIMLVLYALEKKRA